MRILCCCFGGEAEGEGGKAAANEKTSLLHRKVVEPPLSRGRIGGEDHVTSVRFSKRVRRQNTEEAPSQGHKVQVFRVHVAHLDEMYSDAARLLSELQEEHQKMLDGLKKFKSLFGCDGTKSLAACLAEINSRQSGTTFHVMFSSAHSFSLCPEGDVSTPEVQQAVAEVAALNKALKEIISRAPRLQLSLQRIVGEQAADRERVEAEHQAWADRQRALMNFDKNLAVLEEGLGRLESISAQAQDVLRDVKVAVDG